MKRNSQKPLGEHSLPTSRTAGQASDPPAEPTAPVRKPSSSGAQPAKKQAAPKPPDRTTASLAARSGSKQQSKRSGKSPTKPSAGTGPRTKPAKPAASGFEFDVCISFAGENRAYIAAVVRSLKRRGITCFYDRDEQANLWGKDLYTLLDEVYRKKARFCVMFVSEHYARKLWTNHERQSIQARLFESAEDYLLPVRLDDTEIPGLRPTLGYIDGRLHAPAEVAALIQTKVTGAAQRSGTRSGIVPKTAGGIAAKSAGQETTSSSGNRRPVTNSGKWVLLGDRFFEAERVERSKERIQVQIAPQSAREEAELRALESRPQWNRRDIAFAYGNDGLRCRIEDISSQSEKGKTIYKLGLQADSERDTSREVAVQNLSADQIAEKRARLILLGERPATGDSFQDRHIEHGFGSNTYEPCIIAKILRQLGGATGQDNLRKARLSVIYHLVSSGIVEHVLEFSLGPATRSHIPVRFEGRRHGYDASKPLVIRIDGSVPLSE